MKRNASSEEPKEEITCCQLVMYGDHVPTYLRDYDPPVEETKALSDLSRSGKWRAGAYETVLYDGTLTVYESEKE